MTMRGAKRRHCEASRVHQFLDLLPSAAGRAVSEPRIVVTNLLSTLRDKVATDGSASAYYATRLLLDVKPIFDAVVNRGATLLEADVATLQGLQETLSSTTLTSSAALEPLHQTLVGIGSRVAG